MSGWDDLANDQRVQRAVRDGNEQLHIAECAHAGTVALATAALDELRRLAPDSPIHNSQVQKRISAQGGRALDRSNNFQAVWDLIFDLDELFIEVVREFEQNKAMAIRFIEDSKVTKHRHFFRPWKTYGRIRVGPRRTKLDFASVDAASTARDLALGRARRAQLGDQLNIFRLLKPS